MPAGGRRGEERRRGPRSSPRPIVDSRTGLRAQGLVAGRRRPPRTAAAGRRWRRPAPPPAARTRSPNAPGSSGTGTSAGARATRPYAVRLWCDTPRCRVARRRPRTPAATATAPAAQRRGGVDRLAGAGAGEAPPGAGAEVARPLGHDGDVGAARRGPAASRPVWTLTASRSPPNACPTVTRRGEPARRRAAPTTVREKARRQRAAVGHHVGDPRARRPVAQPGEHRRQRRSAGRRPRPASRPGRRRRAAAVVVRALLLVDAEDHGLQRGVAGLDHVPRPRGRVGRQPVGQGDDERHSRRCPARAPAR